MVLLHPRGSAVDEGSVGREIPVRLASLKESSGSPICTNFHRKECGPSNFLEEFVTSSFEEYPGLEISSDGEIFPADL